MEPIAISLSRGKLVLLVLGSAGFVALGVWLWGQEDVSTKIVAVFCGGFFGYCGLLSLRKLLDPSPGLLIDSEGFTDNSSAMAAGRVEWKDVTGLRLSTISGQTFLSVDVADPDEFLERYSPLVAKAAQLNLSLAGSPVNISANSLSIDIDELYATFRRFYEHHRRMDKGIALSSK